MRTRTKLLISTTAALLAFPVGGLISELANPLHPPHDLEERLAAATPPPSSHGNVTLCIDGPEFMAAMRADLAVAQQRAVIQTFSFEADAAGTALAAALVESPAAEKTLLIDAYSRFVQSDKLIFAPTRLLDVPLGEETARTRRLIEHLESHGVQVAYGRAFGPGQDNFAARDHKKIIVIDDTAYVGGINFSDHNFLWHDLMLRITDAGLADMLAADVARSWQGESVNGYAVTDRVEIVIGSGDGDTTIHDRLAAAIRAAESSIYLECPYITEPYFDLLGDARRRGVAVTILTSEQNNRLGLKQSIMDACERHDLELRLVSDRMTHVKAMLVDDRELILGSANFDFLSASLQPEIVAVVTDDETIENFRQRVMNPAMAVSWRWSADDNGPYPGRLCAGVMSVARSVLTETHER